MAEKSDKTTTKTKEPQVHPNLFAVQWLEVPPTSLKDINLPFSAIRPLQAISGIALPVQFLDGANSGIIANTSCNLLLFLKHLGASDNKMNWAKELVKSGRLPTEFQLDSFLELMKNVEAKKHNLETLSKLIEGSLNLFRTKVEKKDERKDVESFMKQSKDMATCAKGGAGKKGKKDADKVERGKMIQELINSIINEVIEIKIADPCKFLTGVPPSDAVSAFILAVMTTDNRNYVGDKFDFLQVLNGVKQCENIAEVLFDIEPVFRVSLAFWKTHIQESNKLDTFHVFQKEVEAYMLGFLRTWGEFLFGGTIKVSTITRLYKEVMHGLALLSGCDSRRGNLVNVSLAILQHVLHNIDSLVYVKLDGVFFQLVGEYLGFQQTSRVLKNDEVETFYDMSAVQKEIDGLTESWGRLCYRAGLSNDRGKILDFLSAMYKKDLNGSLNILRTFIGSGKTASLTLLMLLKLSIGKSAVFMTPCQSEVINFFAGIRFQIEGLIFSDAFKSLKKDDGFKKYMLELIGRLDKLRVFESPLALGQKLDPHFMNIFVLAPTKANILWLLGNRYDMLVLDDVSFSHELARRVSMQGHGSAIIVSGADVGEFDAGDFLPQGYSVDVCDIQNPIDVRSVWEKAKSEQEEMLMYILHKIFLTRKFQVSELKALLVKVGISVRGDVVVSDEERVSLSNFKRVLHSIALEPISACQRFNLLYQREMLMSFDTGMKFGNKAIVYETGDETGDKVSCITTLISSLVQVEDAHVPPTFSKESLGVSPDDSAPNDDEEGDSNPQASGGDATSVKKKDKKEGNKKALKEARNKADDANDVKSSKEVPTRPATMEDIRLKTLVAQNPRRLSPTEQQKTVFKTLVAKLRLPENYKTALITLFENGVGRVSRVFPSEYNEFVASVFRQNGLSYISTSYPLESMNLGHVSAVVVMSSISERDLRQLLGRMNRPNSGSFLQMLEDGRLVLIVLDDTCQDEVDGSLVGGVGAGQNLDFQSIVELGNSLHISENVTALHDVLHGSFSWTSSMFPDELQQRIESLFTSSIFRAFHPDMHFSDRNVLPRDCACVIASAIDMSHFPVGGSAYTTSSIFKTLFGTSSDSESMKKVFGRYAHLMPVLCATRVSDIQGFDTPELILQVVSELSKVASAIECALCVVSMTTPILELMRKVIRERMSVIATLLSKTSSRLQGLITLFETKRATMLRNLEKSEAKLGAVVCEVGVDQDALDFSSLVKSTLDALLTNAEFSDLVAKLEEFISSHGDSSKIIANANMFLVMIKGLEQERASFFEHTSSASSVCDDLCQRRDKLSVLMEWSALCALTVINSKQRPFKFLDDMLTKLKIGEDGKILLAFTINSLAKKPEIQNLTGFYGDLCGLLVRTDFLKQGQCDGPDSEGKVSEGAFNTLKEAIKEFSKTVPADLSAVNARFAELTVEIDRVQQELFVLRDVFELKINSLRHFTKMG